MFRPTFAWAVLLVAAAMPTQAQDANFGFSVPMTISGGALYTGRLQTDGVSPFTAGFRAMFYPTLKLGSHWFAYAAVQVRLAPYFYYDAYDPKHQVLTDLIQGYAGYSWHKGK